MKYAIVRQFIYGWDYTETDDQEQVILYDTEFEASESLLNYIIDVTLAFGNGYLNEPYDEDCKVIQCDPNNLKHSLKLIN